WLLRSLLLAPLKARQPLPGGGQIPPHRRDFRLEIGELRYDREAGAGQQGCDDDQNGDCCCSHGSHRAAIASSYCCGAAAGGVAGCTLAASRSAFLTASVTTSPILASTASACSCSVMANPAPVVFVIT